MEGWAILFRLLLARLLLVLLPSALPLSLLPLYLPAQDTLIQVWTSTCRCGSTRSLPVVFIMVADQQQRSGNL